MAQFTRTLGEVMNATLPQELVDMVESFVFTNGPQAVVSIEAGCYSPPSNITVNKAYRQRLRRDYYRHTTFEVRDAATCIRWLESLPTIVQLDINTIRLGGPPNFAEAVRSIRKANALVMCPCKFGARCRWEELGSCLTWLREKYFTSPRPGGRDAVRWRDTAFRIQHEAIKTWFCLPDHNERTPRIEWTHYYRDALERINLAGYEILLSRVVFGRRSYSLPSHAGTDDEDDEDEDHTMDDASMLSQSSANDSSDYFQDTMSDSEDEK
ncbi:hypothetical protein LTR95_009463 [Oleoguttula sp. CCFEE 5521]